MLSDSEHLATTFPYFWLTVVTFPHQRSKTGEESLLSTLELHLSPLPPPHALGAFKCGPDSTYSCHQPGVEGWGVHVSREGRKTSSFLVISPQLLHICIS